MLGISFSSSFFILLTCRHRSLHRHQKDCTHKSLFRFLDFFLSSSFTSCSIYNYLITHSTIPPLSAGHPDIAGSAPVKWCFLFDLLMSGPFIAFVELRSLMFCFHIMECFVLVFYSVECFLSTCYPLESEHRIQSETGIEEPPSALEL